MCISRAICHRVHLEQEEWALLLLILREGEKSQRGGAYNSTEQSALAYMR